MTGQAGDRVNAAMRPQTLPPLKAFERKLDELVELRQRHDHASLAELWRRAEHSPGADGYPASSMGPGIRSSDADSSTEAAALADDVPDQILAALAEAITEVSEAHGLMRRVDRRLVFAKAVGESNRGRQATGGDCVACGEFVSGAPSDRLRAGYCPACHRAWCRFREGRGDEQGALRREFAGHRRAELAEDEDA